MKNVLMILTVFLATTAFSQDLIVLTDTVDMTDDVDKKIGDLKCFDVVSFIKKNKNKKGKLYVEIEGKTGWIESDAVNYYENYKRKKLQKGRSIFLPSDMKYEYDVNVAGKVEGVPYVSNEYKVYNDDLFINNIVYPISIEKKMVKFKKSSLNKDARIAKIDYRKEAYFIDNLFNSESPECPIYILIYKIDDTHSGSISITVTNTEDAARLSLLAKKILFSIE